VRRIVGRTGENHLDSLNSGLTCERRAELIFFFEPASPGKTLN
jgi:hypothetical protein